MDYAFNEQEKRAVKAFLEHWVYIRVLRDTFEELYERPSSIYILSNTANDFFGYLNDVLINYLNLAYARVLDPFDERHSNLTIEYLHQLRKWQEPESVELEDLKKRIFDFKKYVKQPRDKLFAHNDLKTYLAQGKVLGGFPKGEDLLFIKNVERILNIIHEKAFGTIVGDIVTSNPGDAIDLVRHLRMGLAFHRLFTESTPKVDVARLIEYLDEIDKEANATNEQDSQEERS